MLTSINAFGFLLEAGVDKIILELGSAQGHSTFYLSSLCKYIYATDISKDNCKLIENLNLKIAVGVLGLTGLLYVIFKVPVAKY